MEISLNQEKHVLPEGSSLLDLVSGQVGEKQNGIALAVNNQVIPKAQWADYICQPADQVLIIKATQGG